MEQKEKQRLRLLYLMKIFLEKTDDEHSLTAKQIINELSSFEISIERKTLYSDIRLLNEFGIDIVKENDGRDRLYHIGERDFELPELKLLVDSVQASRFITGKKSDVLIRKLEGLTSIYEGKQLDRQVYVAGRVKTGNENIYYNVDSLHNAIGQNVRVHFQYFQWNTDKCKQLRHDGKIYKVSPWALTCDNDNYYLVGFDEELGEIRHYRVDKMINIELTSAARNGQAQFDNFNIATYTNKLFGMFDGAEKRVKLRVKNDSAGIIIDRFGIDVNINRIDSDWFETEVNVVVSDHFLGWIISLGDKVVIEEPEEVVLRMKEIGERIMGMYG